MGDGLDPPRLERLILAVGTRIVAGQIHSPLLAQTLHSKSRGEQSLPESIGAWHRQPHKGKAGIKAGERRGPFPSILLCKQKRSQRNPQKSNW